MRRSIAAMVLVAVLFSGCAGVPSAFAQTPGQAIGAPLIKRTVRNTLEFDHLNLRAMTDDPVALEIGDGDLFQVIVSRTDPRLFRYAISAAQEDGAPASSLAVDPTPVIARTDGRANLTMRHDKHFARYRVNVTALVPTAGVAPTSLTAVDIGSGNKKLILGGTDPGQREGSVETETAALYPVSFDVWVLTRPEWKVSISGGVAFSGLTDRKFFVKTDAAGKKTVEEDVAARDTTRHDIVALANVYFDRQILRGLMFGAAFGIGQNSAGAPRYYLGPSVVLGRNFVFSGGLAFGSVAGPPTGQVLGEPPISGDNTLNNLGSKFGRGGFVSVAFTFVNKESEFKNAFSSSTTTTPGAVAALSIADLAGDYVEGTTVRAKVEATKTNGKDGLPLTLTLVESESKIVLTKEKGQLTFTSEDGKKEARFSGKKDDLTLQYVEGGAVKLSLKKKQPAA